MPDTNFNIPVPKKVLNLYASYTLSQWLRNLNAEFILGNRIYVSVKLTKNAALDKYIYIGYGIRLYSRSEFLFPMVAWE